MRRGEVRWYHFARPDKKRPVLVLTRDSALEFLGEVTVAPITTTIRDIPTEVVLTAADGMPRACAVNLDHIDGVTGQVLPLHHIAADRAEMRAALLFAQGSIALLEQRSRAPIRQRRRPFGSAGVHSKS
jgi:mRNA interferase MazF